MPLFKLTRQALDDLREIGRYTQKQWGKEQRRVYLNRLDESFHRIAENPVVGRSAEHIRAEYRCCWVEKHVIFYKSQHGAVLIVRILHQNMDVPQRLAD